MTKLLLNVEEAAEAIGVRRSTFYGLLARGEIESVRVGRSRRIPVDALESYVARLRAESQEAVTAG